MTQLISLGRRKAPVRNTRSRCATIAAEKSSAAQWCAWRMTSPARTSKVSRMPDSKACDISTPCSGS